MTTQTTPSVAIIDYGLGNIASVRNAFAAVGVDASLVADPNDVATYDKVVLPGVGAFGRAIENLRADGMDEALRSYVGTGKSLLGVCLGMQLICSSSEEGGMHDGFNWVKAKVTGFPEFRKLKVPHIGWNTLEFTRDSNLFAGMISGADVYFVHSFKVEIDNPEDMLAYTDYGETFASIIQSDNVIGMQFHPEKSQAVGLRLIENFCFRL